MGLEQVSDLLFKYSHGIYGITHAGQYLSLFVLSFNPSLFKMFKPRHFLFLIPGILLSVFNHRAILPFLVLIMLDMDYSKLDKGLKQQLFLFFCISVGILSCFGGNYYGNY
jgi:hypothetical protein